MRHRDQSEHHFGLYPRVILSSEVGLKQINLLSLGWVMLSLLLLQRFKLKIIPLSYRCRPSITTGDSQLL